MRGTISVIARPAAICLLAAFTVISDAHAQGQRRDQGEYPGWNRSVGRNAPQAISAGLAEQGAGWLDAMANFYTDPRTDNRGYFDYYRRPYYGRAPSRRDR